MMVELARRIQNPQNKTLKEKTGHLRYKIKLLLTDGISSSGNLKLLRCFKSFFFPVLDLSESVSSGSRSSNSAFHLPKRILVEE